MTYGRSEVAAMLAWKVLLERVNFILEASGMLLWDEESQ